MNARSVQPCRNLHVIFMSSRTLATEAEVLFADEQSSVSLLKQVYKSRSGYSFIILIIHLTHLFIH